MRNFLFDSYAFLLGWPALSRLNTALFYLSGRALGLHNYSSQRISGERSAIARCLAGVSRPVVFDVGANAGDWTETVLELDPGSQVHAFEPQAELAARLAVRHSGVVVNTLALGEQEDTLTLYDYDDHPGSQHASLLQGVIDEVHGGKARGTSVKVTTLDQYCASHGIDRIDLLKIDVEGFELKVMRGAARMIRESRIAAIQFEFNEMNLLGRTFLNDFMKQLQPRYELHRVLPHGLLPLRSHSHWFNEQFIFQNIVAIRK